MYSQLWYLSDRDNQRRRMRKNYLKNRELRCSQAREYYYKNREDIIIKNNEYARKNRKMANEWGRNWAKKHPECAAASEAKRRSVQKNALPKWVDVKEIKSIYRRAQEISRRTGIKHNVDHIYPLVHERFAGLHVPWNLQIIPEKENFSKNNRVSSDMLAMRFH